MRCDACMCVYVLPNHGMYDTNTPRVHVHERAGKQANTRPHTHTMFGRSSAAAPEPHARGEDSSVPKERSSWVALPRDRPAATVLIAHDNPPHKFSHGLTIRIPEVGQEEDLDLTEAIAAGKVAILEDIRRVHGLSLEVAKHINPIGNCIISELSFKCLLDGAPLTPGNLITVALFRNIPRPTYVQVLLDAFEANMPTSQPTAHRIMAGYMATALDAAASGITLNHNTLHHYLSKMNTTAIPVGVLSNGITVHQTLEESNGEAPVGQTCNVHCTLWNHTKKAKVKAVSIPDSQRKSTYFHGNLFMHLGIQQGAVKDSEGYATYKFTLNLSPGSVWATHKRRDGSTAIQPHAEHHAVCRAFTEIWRNFVLSTLAAPEGGTCLTAGLLDDTGKRLSPKFPRIVINSKTSETFMHSVMDTKLVDLSVPTEGRGGGGGGAEPSSMSPHVTVFTPRMDIITASKFAIYAIASAVNHGYPILTTGDMFLRIGHRKAYMGPPTRQEPAKAFHGARSHAITSDFVPEDHGDDTPSAPPTYLTTFVKMKVHLLSPGSTRMGPQFAGCLPCSRMLVPPLVPEPKPDAPAFSPA